MRLAKKGELLTHNKDRAIWTLMSLDTVIEHVYDPVTVGMNLGDLVKVISNSKRNIYPVVDGAGHLLGMVKMDQIRHLMFRTELYQRFRVEGLMISCPEKLLTTDTMEEVMQKFEKSKVWHLPVVDGDDKYVGFVSKSQIFSTYRQVLADMSED
jgi:CIC family chloride channel protein